MTASLLILADAQERLIMIAGTVLFVLWLLSSLSPKSKDARNKGVQQQRRIKPGFPRAPVQSRAGQLVAGRPVAGQRAAGRGPKQVRPKSVRVPGPPQLPIAVTTHAPAPPVPEDTQVIARPITPSTPATLAPLRQRPRAHRLLNVANLRQQIVMAELLAPPLALRGDERRP